MVELGVHLTATGARAAFPAPGAEGLELCVFEGRTEIRYRLEERVGDVFAGDVPLAAGAHYGLRADGPGMNPAKLLADPWARRIDRAFALHPSLFGGGDSSDAMPKAVLEAAATPVPPPLLTGARVIYELHVRGFTMQHPDVPAALRGTFAGLAHPAAIGHLRDLGVTHVELLPCAAWIDERHLPPLGLSNYWGYNPVGFLAPDPRLAPGGMAEVRAAVAALAGAGIGVILDVVLNHSGESDRDGPTLSLRGLGEAAWYHMRDGALENHAGTGNALALHQPWPLRLSMDALRHWAAQGLAGFRLDLAATLGRRAEGFDAHAPLLLAMQQDPVLRERLIIAEPWDIGPGGYRLGHFPAGWPEWNDRFRDDSRRFWRGDAGMLGDFTTRFAGSADLFTGRPATDSLNFVTAHDGFTLRDLVSYENRHNQANGEQNRDGGGENHSWNNGVEGNTDAPAILARREADVRALLLLLLTARGTPMLTMGDELGRSQGGNNNAYCQDGPLSWQPWPGNAALTAFTARLVRARRAHPALDSRMHLTGTIDATGHRDVAWHHPSGGAPDWGGQALLALLSADGDRVAVAFNAGEDAWPLALPQPRPGHAWRLLADSAAPEAAGVPAMLAGRGALLLAEEKRATSRAPEDDMLRALATAAGIETRRQDAGAAADVPLDTLRLVLDALQIPRHSGREAQAAIHALATPPALPRHPVLVADAEGTLLLGPGFRGDEMEVALEGGGRLRVAITAEPHWQLLPDGTHIRGRRAAMPALPAGHHRLLAEGCEAALTVAPRRAFLPGGGRFFGLAAQTYGLRRDGDQGVGDYTALGIFAAEAAAAGARLLGISPPHALMPRDRERASPYQPSDRRFLEPVLIDLAGLPGAAAALEAEAGLFSALSAGATVDYAAVWAAKRRVLRAALQHAPPELDGFIAAGGKALARFATFTAMAEHGGPILPHAADPGVAAFQAAHADAIRFVQFQQFIADRQLAAAAAAGAGLYRDLAVGSAPDGAEVWCSPDGFMRGFSLGVPPDALGPLGQVWGLPAPRPDATPAHFAELLAANTRHAAALRIDHVMAVQRLFLVPDGATGADGCYLAYPRDAMLAELTLASQRARCMIIGEDLGTVPEGLGQVLAGADVLSYRVLWFQRDENGMWPPAEWKETAAACVSTHDLPTLAGWWEGADLAERRALGLLQPEMEQARVTERQHLLAALAESGHLPGGITTEDAFSDALAAAIHAHVAAGACLVMLAQAEDLAGETVAVNLPGTDRERPNWRHRLSVPVPGLTETPRGRAIIAAIKAVR